MNTVRKTIIFSQIDGRFSQNSPIAGLLHIEATDSSRNGIRVIFSNIDGTAAEGWFLALKCGEKFVVNPVKIPEDYFLTDSLDTNAVTEAVLMGEESGRKIPAAYASSAGGDRDAFVRRALALTDSGECFYKENAREFLTVFTKNKPYSPLIKAFKESYWVKLEKGEAFYLQGIILRGDKPLYICFAMPERFVKRSEKAFTYLSFNGKSGYYLAFQNAFTGKTVKPDIRELLDNTAVGNIILSEPVAAGA